MVNTVEDKYNVAARMDRLPTGRFTVLISIVGAIAIFYDIFAIDQVGLVLPTMVKLYGWTSTQASLTVGMLFIGMFVGSIVLGRVSDRVGRRNILTLTILVMAVGSLISSLSGNIYLFNVGRFISGIGVGGDFPIAWTYVNEMLPIASRGRMFSITYIIGVASIPAAGYLVAYSLSTLPLVQAWRIVFYVGAALAIPFYIARYEAPESPRYFLVHNKQEEAKKAIENIEHRFTSKGVKLAEPEVRKTVRIGQHAPISALFTPKYRRRSIAMILTYVFGVSAFYGFTAYLPSFLVSEGFSIVGSAIYSTIAFIGGIIGPFFMFALGEKVDRRYATSAYLIILVVLILLFIEAHAPLQILIIAFFINVFLQAQAATFEGFSGEIWPSYMRGTGTGLGNGIARGYNAIALFVIGSILAGSIAHQLTFVYISFIGMMIAIIATGVKTNNRSLESFTEEDEEGPSKPEAA